MINIVFIGSKHNKRIKILKSISDSKLHIINTIKSIPEIVIDLFVVDHTYKYIDYNSGTILKNNKKLKHIPIISLIKKSENIDEKCVSDIIVSNIVSDAEFKNYVNTMIKMKLMDDELKKDKIILELKVKERTLEHQNKATRLNIILNSIGDGVIVTDSKGKIELINPTVKTLCNINNDDYLNKKIHNIFKFFINDKEIDLFKIVKNTQEKFCLPIDSILVTKTKKIRISDSASPIFDLDGNFNGVVIVFHDITEDYEMRQNLINSEKKYKSIYDNVPDIIYTYDMNGYITSINKNINILGYTKNEVLGKNISMLITPDSYEISKKEIEIKKNNNDIITIYNVTFLTKNNEKRIYEIKSNIIKNFNDSDNEIFATARDITESIKSRIALKESKEIAEKSNNMKTMFISTMTHEIKTPLNSIMGFSSIILDNLKSEKLKEYANMIITSGNKLDKIIDDIICISDSYSGSLKINKKYFNVNDLLKDVDSICCDILNSRNKLNVKLNLDLTDDYIIYNDYEKIKNILIEIITNSIKFTVKGHIIYGFYIIDDKIEFYVEDTGIGIEHENLDKIYDTFYQINRHKFKKQEGTGLGLSLCKCLVDALDGEIEINSEYNEGTFISIKINIDDDKKIIDTSVTHNIIENKNVLLIVKNESTYNILTLLLSSMSFIIKQTSDYNDSMNEIENNKFDLIIIDFNNLSFNPNDLIKEIIKKNHMFIIASNNKTNFNKHTIDFPINPSQLIDKIKNMF